MEQPEWARSKKVMKQGWWGSCLMKTSELWKVVKACISFLSPNRVFMVWLQSSVIWIKRLQSSDFRKKGWMVGKSSKIFYCLRWPFKHISLCNLIFEIWTPELLTEVTWFLVNKVHREIQFNRLCFCVVPPCSHPSSSLNDMLSCVPIRSTIWCQWPRHYAIYLASLGSDKMLVSNTSGVVALYKDGQNESFPTVKMKKLNPPWWWAAVLAINPTFIISGRIWANTQSAPYFRHFLSLWPELK